MESTQKKTIVIFAAIAAVAVGSWYGRVIAAHLADLWRSLMGLAAL